MSRKHEKACLRLEIYGCKEANGGELTTTINNNDNNDEEITFYSQQNITELTNKTYL